MYTVTLHHLAPEAKQAGSTFADIELSDVSERKLRTLIRALADRATENHGNASPELRVVAPHGQFVVQAVGGRLRINSWTMRVGGADLSPDQIFNLITGSNAVADAVVEANAGVASRSRRVLLFVCFGLILATNGITAWFLTRRPETPFLPRYVSLGEEPGRRFLASVAGEYQSGTVAGSRVLTLTATGDRARWKTLSSENTVAEESEVSVHPVQSAGRPALLADDRALIEFPDPATLVFYNETYRRKAP